MTQEDRRRFGDFARTKGVPDEFVSEVVRMAFDGVRGDDFVQRAMVANDLLFQWFDSIRTARPQSR